MWESDTQDTIFIIFISALIGVTSWAITQDYWKRQLSAKENEFTTAVRRAAYNKTHLCLDDGTFYDVKIYRMDGNREFYTVTPAK